MAPAEVFTIRENLIPPINFYAISLNGKVKTPFLNYPKDIFTPHTPVNTLSIVIKALKQSNLIHNLPPPPSPCTPPSSFSLHPVDFRKILSNLDLSTKIRFLLKIPRKSTKIEPAFVCL